MENKSNKGMIIGAVVAGILLIGGIAAFGNSSKVDTAKKEIMSNVSEISKDAMMKKDDAMMMKNKMSMSSNSMMMKDKTSDSMMKKTGYMAFSQDEVTKNSGGTNIIFFHAPWCPTCKAAEADINNNLGSIPTSFNILKTDFDTSTALRQKYGVTSQSTFVKIDKDGNKLSMGNGFTKLADIVAFGQK